MEFFEMEIVECFRLGIMDSLQVSGNSGIPLGWNSQLGVGIPKDFFQVFGNSRRIPLGWN